LLRAGSGSSIEARLESRCAALDAALEAAQEELSAQQREITELSACLDDARSLASQSVVADHYDDIHDDGRSVGHSFESRNNLPNRSLPPAQPLANAGTDFVGTDRERGSGEGGDGNDDEDHVRFGDGSVDFSCLNGSLDGPMGATILGARSSNGDISPRGDASSRHPLQDGATLEPLQSCDLEPRRYSDDDDDEQGYTVESKEVESERTPQTSLPNNEATGAEEQDTSLPQKTEADSLDTNVAREEAAVGGAKMIDGEAKEEMDITSLSDDSLSPVGQNLHVSEWFNAGTGHAMDGAVSPVTSPTTGNGRASHPSEGTAPSSDVHKGNHTSAIEVPTNILEVAAPVATSSLQREAGVTDALPPVSDHTIISESKNDAGSRVTPPPNTSNTAVAAATDIGEAAANSSDNAWVQYWDVNGQPYWYCETTGEWWYENQDEDETPAAAANHREGWTNDEGWKSGIKEQRASAQDYDVAISDGTQKAPSTDFPEPAAAQETTTTQDSAGVAPDAATAQEVEAAKSSANKEVLEATEHSKSHHEVPSVPSSKSNLANHAAAAAAPSTEQIEPTEQPTPPLPVHRCAEIDSTEAVPAATTEAAAARLASLEARNRELEAALATLVCNNSNNRNTATITEHAVGIPSVSLDSVPSEAAKPITSEAVSALSGAAELPSAAAAAADSSFYPQTPLPPASGHAPAHVAPTASVSSLEPSSSSSPSSVHYSHDPDTFPRAGESYLSSGLALAEPERKFPCNNVCYGSRCVHGGGDGMGRPDTVVAPVAAPGVASTDVASTTALLPSPPQQQQLQQYLSSDAARESSSSSSAIDGNHGMVGASAALALRRRAAAAEERAALAEAAAADAKELLASMEHEALRAQRASAARERELESRLKRAESKLAALGEDDDAAGGDEDDTTLDGHSDRREGQMKQHQAARVPRKMLMQQVADLRTQAMTTENALNQLRVAFAKAESEVSRLREDRNRAQGECAAADERAANHAMASGQERARAEAAVNERDAALASAANASAALASEQRRVARRDAKIAEVEAARVTATRRLEAERAAREEVSFI